ncbi:MFS transporter [Amnibacterium kyonggiense]|uniref:Putative MFS transporter n=1 Tax=Amnibacterium kyonggiense TaxID=595671 RepID=A0A4R7FRB5_9MICO|nr:MFS transporter [Amnibacterium kyonggiense]TDS80248.1 putative MFS transporter [Amnibacterium kyonggiense]
MTSTAAPPRTGLVRRLAFAATWGEGLDGFDLGVISVALPFITKALGLTPVEAGLIGASSLIGIFVGAPLAGFLTDRLGRRLLFTIDVMAFIVLGLLQGVVTDGLQLFVVRVLLGVAIGAEYSIGAAMLSEFAPARGRGRRLSGLLVGWYGGYLVAVITAYVLIDGLGLSWRWALACSALPALVTALVRIGFPESPPLLLAHGRGDEARAIVYRHLGGSQYFDDERFGAEEDGPKAALFRGENLKRLAFLSVFWACNVAPYFAIFTFAPTVLKTLQLGDPAVGTIVVNAMAAVGAVVGMLSIEHIGRRKQAVPPWFAMAAALAVVGLWAGAPAWVIVLCFAVSSFLNALSGNLTAVYPIEILPTAVRSSGVGVAAAASRVGAAIGTFLLPVGIDAIGTGACMLIAAAICVVGGVVSQVAAPETTNRDLVDTSTSPLTAGTRVPTR